MSSDRLAGALSVAAVLGLVLGSIIVAATLALLKPYMAIEDRH